MLEFIERLAHIDKQELLDEMIKSQSKQQMTDRLALILSNIYLIILSKNTVPMCVAEDGYTRLFENFLASSIRTFDCDKGKEALWSYCYLIALRSLQNEAGKYNKYHSRHCSYEEYTTE